MSSFNRNKCLQVTDKLRNKIKDKVTGTIYHYTTTEGFKGIIESNEIWMTNAMFVNDKTELRASLGDGSIFKDVQFINPDFEEFKNDPLDIDVNDCYLASFSKSTKNNSLSQFRAYGNYCIGFDAKKLKKNKFNLFRCVYEERDIKKWITNNDRLEEWKNECFKNERGKQYKRAAFHVVKYARQVKLKNLHYKAEQEIRLLVVSSASWGLYTDCPGMFCDQPAVYFRDDTFFNAPVPYVKFFIPKKPKSRKELEKMVEGKSRIEAKQIIRNLESEQEKDILPIKEVIIGPVQNQEEVVIATKILLLENGYDNVIVKSSDIPFRGK